MGCVWAAYGRVLGYGSVVCGSAAVHMHMRFAVNYIIKLSIKTN